MNKNNIIFILFVAALIGSTWGAVVNRQKIDLAQQLKDAQEQLRKISMNTGSEQAQVTGVAGESRQRLAENDVLLDRARKELEALRTQTQETVVKLSGCTAELQELTRERDSLALQLKIGEAAPGPGNLNAEGIAGGGKMAKGLEAEGVPLNHEEANAQIIGLETIIEEKNTALQDAAREKERLQINLDVLLARISELQRELQAEEEVNRELLKQVTAAKEKSIPTAGGQEPVAR